MAIFTRLTVRPALWLLAFLLGSAASASARPAVQQSTSPFALPEIAFANFMWTDGKDQVVLFANNEVIVVPRGRPAQSLKLPDSSEGGWGVALAGAAQGANRTLVVVRANGQLWRQVAGQWEAGQVPLADKSPGEPPSSSLASTVRQHNATIDLQGQVYVVSRDLLRVWDKAGWQSYPLPELKLSIIGMAAARDGKVYLADDKGRCWSFKEGSFTQLTMSPTPVMGADDRWVSTWYSPVSHTLWVAYAKDYFLSIELDSGRTTLRSLPDSVYDKRINSLTGAPGAHGDLIGLITGFQNEVLYFDGQQVHKATPGYGFSLSVAYDPICLIPDERRLLVGGERPREYMLTWQQQIVMEPEDVQDPGYPGQRRLVAPWSLGILTRINLGRIWHQSPGVDGSNFGLDATIGLIFAKRRAQRFRLLPELGYSYDQSEQFGGHRFLAGLGIGYGPKWLTLYYTPWLVAGTLAGAPPAAGFRQSLGLHLLDSSLIVEFAHQLLPRPEGLDQEYRLMFGINALGIVGVIYSLVLISAPARWVGFLLR